MSKYICEIINEVVWYFDHSDKLNPFYGVDPDDSAELFTELPDGNMELLPHSSGGLPNITDAAFSVIVVFYVSVTFCFVYFAFCFYNTSPRNGSRKGRNSNRRNKSQNKSRQCILMNESETGSKVSAKNKIHTGCDIW